MIWDKPTHNPDKHVTDVPKVGHYLIQRLNKGNRTYVLMLNGISMRCYGTVEELKTIVERSVARRTS